MPLLSRVMRKNLIEKGDLKDNRILEEKKWKESVVPELTTYEPQEPLFQEPSEHALCVFSQDLQFFLLFCELDD